MTIITRITLISKQSIGHWQCFTTYYLSVIRLEPWSWPFLIGLVLGRCLRSLNEPNYIVLLSTKRHTGFALLLHRWLSTPCCLTLWAGLPSQSILCPALWPETRRFPHSPWISYFLLRSNSANQALRLFLIGNLGFLHLSLQILLSLWDYSISPENQYSPLRLLQRGLCRVHVVSNRSNELFHVAQILLPSQELILCSITTNGHIYMPCQSNSSHPHSFCSLQFSIDIRKITLEFILKCVHKDTYHTVTHFCSSAKSSSISSRFWSNPRGQNHQKEQRMWVLPFLDKHTYFVYPVWTEMYTQRILSWRCRTICRKAREWRWFDARDPYSCSAQLQATKYSLT